MNIYQKISVVLALILYLPLSVQIWTKKVEQNLATFILWGSLDAIVAITIYLQNGNFQLAAAYVGGCTLIIICILKARTFSWTWFETFMSIMVVLCIVGWKLSGPYLATIMSTIAMALAGLPQLRKSWKEPEKSPALLYFGYTIANIFSIIGGKSWSIEERFYPVVCTILCILVTLASIRKKSFIFKTATLS